MAGYRHSSIVVLGSFNPAIFQPEWFRSNEILPAAEIDAVLAGPQRLLVHQDATVVAFESLRLEVLQNRWALSTDRIDWQGDLGLITASVFGKLSHTPMEVVGFNVVAHAEAPKSDVAGTLARWLPLEPLANLVGANHQLGATVKADWNGFRVSLGLEPSIKLRTGLYITQNYERKLEKGVNTLLKLVETEWKPVLSRADELQAAILGGIEA